MLEKNKIRNKPKKNRFYVFRSLKLEDYLKEIHADLRDVHVASCVSNCLVVDGFNVSKMEESTQKMRLGPADF